MRIAFITSEFAGLPGSGGIGAYFLNAARCLAGAGHEIEVFTSGTPGQLPPDQGIIFHHVGDARHPFFAVHAAEAFALRHKDKAFDLLESAELKAEGWCATWLVPEVARVVRLHSPSVILNRYLDPPPTLRQKLSGGFQLARRVLGAWSRSAPIPPIYPGSPLPTWFPNQEIEERGVTAGADVVIVMNEEMRSLARNYWWIDDAAIREVPNPLQPPRAQIQTAGKTGPPYTLGFSGRLEYRKGVLPLAEALKQVLPKHPDWRVVLAGREVASCLSGMNVGQMARKELERFGSRVQFLGSLPPEKMDSFLDTIDLYVFPSLWDNFPYAVIEAMAAGKAIVAARTGSVADMLDQGRAGWLTDPGDVPQLVQALDALMGDAGRRQKLGESARQRVLSKYSEEIVTTAILDTYTLALKRRDRRMSAGKGSHSP